jgi:hypothetical protein
MTTQRYDFDTTIPQEVLVQRHNNLVLSIFTAILAIFLFNWFGPPRQNFGPEYTLWSFLGVGVMLLLALPFVLAVNLLRWRGAKGFIIPEQVVIEEAPSYGLVRPLLAPGSYPLSTFSKITKNRKIYVRNPIGMEDKYLHWITLRTQSGSSLLIWGPVHDKIKGVLGENGLENAEGKAKSVRDTLYLLTRLPVTHAHWVGLVRITDHTPGPFILPVIPAGPDQISEQKTGILE